MEKMMKVLKWGGALFVGIIAYAVFLMTMAPTVSFWDCGEFIAAANILGIPHPPGTPFFVILGRVAIILMPWIDEIAARVNLVSVISSALAVFFSYLVAWEALEQWLRGKNRYDQPSTRWVLPIAGLVAGFLVAFSDTFWFNAVEAEVYGAAMTVVMMITWLSLVWMRRRETPFGDRLLIFIAYLAFLGIGLQLYTMITLPALFAFLLLVEPDFRRRERAPFWISAALLYSVVYKVESFPEISVSLLLITAIALIVTKAQKNAVWVRTWRLSFWLVVVALIGYSTHAYIPIRSALNPAIDENDPELHFEKLTDVFDQDKWGRFNDFLARKQYGSESMITRAFHRRADLSNQLLTWPHMGFGGYQFAQYLPWKVGEVRFGREYRQWAVAPEDNPPTEKLGISFPTQMVLFNDSLLPQLLIFLLFNGAIGFVIWRLWRGNRSVALYIAALYITTTFGLLFYMNFADGLGSERVYYEHWLKNGSPSPGPQTVQLEVRERDYFYTPGFMLMGIIFGIGAGLGVEALWRRRGSQIAKGAGVALAAVAFAVPLGTNYKEHDRSGQFIPWDYAYNLINSCEPNSILFTNGDNDTFPLWFIQEVENIRKDVRVVNLSLGNTDWYIRQILENEPILRLDNLSKRLDKLDGYDALVDPRSYQVEQQLLETDTLLQTLLGQLQLMQQEQQYRDSVVALRGEEFVKRWEEVQTNNIMRVRNHKQMFLALQEWMSNYKPPYMKVQDQLVIDLMLSNPERPLHFATTVGRENFVGLDRYMDMEGMVFTLRRFELEPQGQLNIARTRELVESVYKYRCIEDKSCYINDETQRLLYNYNTIYFRLMMEARRELSSVRPMLAMLDQQSDSLQTESVSMMKEDLKRREKEAVEMGEFYLHKSQLQFPHEWRSYIIGADFYLAQEKADEAIALLERGLTTVPDYDRMEIAERLLQLKQAFGETPPLPGES